MNDCLVIIPTYNEAGNMEKMVRKVFSLPLPFDLLVIDDGSPDGTADIVKGLQNEFEGRLHLMERKGKLGLGTAYIAGFRWALERNYSYIFEMDCDFSHHPDDLLRLHREAAAGADLVIGSRYVKGGGFVNWPKDRIMISMVASIYANLVLWMGIRDTTAGFVCYRRSMLENLDLQKIRFVGYAFQIEMKFACKQIGGRLKEVPIIFTERVEGVSKMSKNIIKEGILGVLQIRWYSLFHSYRKS